MKLETITSEEDHALALARIEELFGAELGTSAAQELDALVTLVHDYEAKHHPILLPDSLEAINFRVDQALTAGRDQ